MKRVLKKVTSFKEFEELLEAGMIKLEDTRMILTDRGEEFLCLFGKDEVEYYKEV